MIGADAAHFVLRLGLAGVFALAGVTKLFDSDGFRQAFVEFGGPLRAAKAFSLVVPPLELAVAFALVPRATASYGAVGAVALLLLFTAAIGLALVKGRTPNCHCFGQLKATAIGWRTLVRNGVLLLAAAPIVAPQAVDPVSIAAVIAGGLVLGLLTARGLRAAGFSGQSGPPVPPVHVPSVPVDSVAPNFALQDLGGATETLEALRAGGRPILLFFLGPACGQCGALVPEVSRWQREHGAVLTIALVSQGTLEVNRAKFGAYGLEHFLLQPHREVNESYGAIGTPSALVVRTDGTIGSALARGDNEIRQLVADWTGSPDEFPVARTTATDAALAAFLRLAARLDCDEDHYRLLADTAARLETWQGLASEADAHGLAPLVSYHLKRAGIELPTRVRRELLGVTMVHGAANRTRFRMLGEILDAFDRAGIPVIVLRGAALAHLLYPSGALRPLDNIDLLVAPELGPRAQEILATLGFTVPMSRRRSGRNMHDPLPVVMKVVAGAEVWVEIHTNAMPGDTATALMMSQLTDGTQAFLVEGRPARTLGHIDMLHHLYRHVAEPARRMRLIEVADIVGYAARYRKEIPWADMRLRYPFVINALSLLDLVTPLPPELTEYVSPGRDRRIRGVGVVAKPPDEIVKEGRPIRDVLRDVFDPSDWWLRLYYGLGSGAALWWSRFVRHPLRMGYWFIRRT